jgi:MoxR-like ATPase
VCAVGASNEVPSDEALLAFYDRFLVRVTVAPVSDAGFEALLSLQATSPQDAAAALADGERDAVRRAREAVVLGSAARDALTALRQWLAAQGLSAPSDRRWRQWVGLMKTMAATEGRAEVDALDLWLAPYVAAAEPGQAAAIGAWFIAQVADAEPHDAAWLERAVEAFEQQLQLEQRAPAESADDEAGKLALARRVGGASSGDALASMRLVSEAMQSATARRWSALHVRTRVEQVREVRARAAAVCTAVTEQIAALQARLAPRLWWPPSWQRRVLAGPETTAARLAALIARLDAVEHGFASLPLRSDGVEQEAPPPLVPV